jgi:hypothetical protein
MIHRGYDASPDDSKEANRSRAIYLLPAPPCPNSPACLQKAGMEHYDVGRIKLENYGPFSAQSAANLANNTDPFARYAENQASVSGPKKKRQL